MKTFSNLSRNNWKSKLWAVLRTIPITPYEIKGFQVLLLSVICHSLWRDSLGEGGLLQGSYYAALEVLMGAQGSPSDQGC